MKKWVAIFSSALLAGGAAVGVSASDAGKFVSYENTVATNTETVTEKDDNQAKDQITKEEAVKAAQAILGGSVKEVELDREEGKLIYEVELYFNGNDYDFDIDAITGDVLSIDDDLLKTPVKNQMKVNVGEAKREALSLFDKAGIKDVELEMKDGRFVYEIEVKVAGEDGDVYIDATTGEVLYIEEDIRNKAISQGANVDHKERSSQESTNKSDHDSIKITKEQAVKTALNHVGGGTIDEVELDREDGILVYEIEIEQDGQEVEVDVDAATGEIVSVDWD
ncbi:MULTISPECIES: PepSY domain-containing protein [Alkalihalophilus]|uniref:Peptidase propeptide and YPEB domain protein n=1 Tax=Alkalihalophilus pseudofirmus (strain ATCC BAA-2126 / JCM 17055 / OF4) TaxID=398511 RepID=D3FVA2_ALKPO|nr:MULTISPECIES: PepSY domain-containing protein [Alkalihalophilus]ADC50303.1 putative peptidase propeptide and YPEB domain protein [Alkalihalophilus pseudofirmus OF4]MEC2072025.1 PepSY domain-containing protein [Alkalihalophilus marmarensis]